MLSSISEAPSGLSLICAQYAAIKTAVFG
jgi:hypothetical protein